MHSSLVTLEISSQQGPAAQTEGATHGALGAFPRNPCSAGKWGHSEDSGYSFLSYILCSILCLFGGWNVFLELSATTKNRYTERHLQIDTSPPTVMFPKPG